jgi:acetyl esterase
MSSYKIDPARDEGLAYAHLLMRAGVPTEVHLYSGATHMAHVIPDTTIGGRMTDDRVEAVRRLLATRA